MSDYVLAGSEDQNGARGYRQVNAMLEAGHKPEDVAAWKARVQDAAIAAGHKPDDVDAYFGDKAPDLGPMNRYFAANLASTDPKDAVRIASDPLEMLRAGWGMSVTGLITGRPQFIMPQHAGVFGQVLSSAGQLAGDLPFALPGMAAGGVAGAAVAGPIGGVAGAGAGFNALPQAMREIMLDYMNRGDIHSYQDFMAVMGKSLMEVGKSALTGAIAAPLGGIAGKAVGEAAGGALGKGADAVTQALTYTAVGGALDGKIPDAESFTAAAVLAGGFHVLAKAVPEAQGKITLSEAGNLVKDNLQHVYREYGITPSQALALSDSHPELRQALLSRDVNGDAVIDAYRVHALDEPPPTTPNPEITIESNGVSAGAAPDVSWLYDSRFKGVNASRRLPNGQVVPDPTAVADYLQKIGARFGLKFQVGQPKTGKFVVGEKGPQMNTVGDTADNNLRRQVYIPDNSLELQRRWYGLSTNEIIFHELGHAMDAAFLGETLHPEADAKRVQWPQAFKDEIQNVSQTFAAHLWETNPQYRSKPQEMFADAIAAYLSNPAARKQMPLFTARFGKQLDPYLKIVEATLPKRTAGGAWEAPPPEEEAASGGSGNGGPPAVPPPPPPPSQPPLGLPDMRMRETPEELADRLHENTITEKPEVKPGGNRVTNFISKYVSELAPAKEIDQLLMERYGGTVEFPKTMMWLQDMFRQTYASKERAGILYRYGGLKLEADKISVDKDVPSLSAVLDHVVKNGGSLEHFDSYLLAVRSLDKAEQGFKVPGDMSLEDRQRIVDGLKLKDTYKEAADMLQKLNDNVLEYGRMSGVFNKRQIALMKVFNPIYASFRFVMGDTGVVRTGSKRGFNVSEPVRQYVGSDGQILSPLAATMDNMEQIVRMADRNRAIGSVVSLADDLLKALGITALPKPEPKATIAEGELDKFKPYLPEDMSSLEPFLAYRSWRGDKNMNKFLYIRDGHPQMYAADNEALARLIRGADQPGEMHMTAQIANKLAQFQRAGLVSTPDFPTRVTWRHQITAFVLDPLHPPPFVTWFSGLMDVLKQNDTFKSWVANGGAGVALVDLDKRYIQEDFSRLMEKTGAGQAVINVVKHPLQFAQLIGERMDAAARVGYFKRAITKGYDPLKAATMSRQAYLDYAERGTLGAVQTMARITPFFRPHLLGLKQGWEAVAERPLETLMYSVGAVTIPTVALFAANAIADQFLPDDRKYKNLPRWEKDNYYITPEIGGVRFRLQMPPNVGIPFGGFAIRALEHFQEKDPDAFNEWAKAFLQSYVPPLVPTALQPVAEEWANRSLWTGKPLIPGSLEGASGQMQYLPNTTEVAKKVANAIHDAGGNLSPITVENYVRNYTGTGGMLVLRALNAPFDNRNAPLEPSDYPFVSSFLVRNPAMTAEPITQFFDHRAEFLQTLKDRQAAQRRIMGGQQNDEEFARTLQDQLPAQGVNGIAVNIKALKSAIEEINQRPTIDTQEYKALSAKERAKSDAMTVDEKRQLTDSLYSDMIHLAQSGLEEMRQIKEQYRVR